MLRDSILWFGFVPPHCLFVLSGKSFTNMLNALNNLRQYIQCNWETRYILFNRFSERHDAPRTNFDNFLKAMLAVFQVCIKSITPLSWFESSLNYFFFIISDYDRRGLECRDVWWDSCIKWAAYNHGNLIIVVLCFASDSGKLYPETQLINLTRTNLKRVQRRFNL